MNMVAVSPLGTIIEDLEQIEALLWEAFLSNNHILSSKNLHDLGTNGGNPDYGSIVSQAGAISRQYRPQIDRIQQALQSSDLSDNRAKELHTQLHQIGSERIEVIERFDRINQLSKGFHCIQAMQAAQNKEESPLLGIEAARQVFDGYSPIQQHAVLYVLKQALLKRDSFQEQTDILTMQVAQNKEKSLLLGIEVARQVFDRCSPTPQDAVRDVLEQALLKRDSFQEQTDIINAISDLCALSDAIRPASMQENLGAMGERAGACMDAVRNGFQQFLSFLPNNNRTP